MRNLVGLVIAVVCVIGCGKKDDKPAPGAGSAPAGSAVAEPVGSAAAGTATAGSAVAGAGSSSLVATAPTATCEAACDHRKACKIPGGDDTAKCTTECKGLADSYTGEVLGQYVKSPCADVAQGEGVFRAAVACRTACAQRAKCIPAASDQKQCLGDCTALALISGDNGIKEIETYATSECSVATAQEPGFQMISACVRGCKYVLGCGVEGTFPGCIDVCRKNLATNALTLEQIAAIEKDTCENVKKTIVINPPQAVAASGGGSCEAACKKFEACSILTYDYCIKEGCAQLSAARLPQYAAASCQQIRSGDLGNHGYKCMREGAQDCQSGMMCCQKYGNRYLGGGGGRATQSGEQGQCLYPSLCYR